MALERSVARCDCWRQRTRHEGLVEYFGEAAARRPRGAGARTSAATALAAPGRRVYVLPGIMGSQLGFVRGGQRPNDILWLDPIDIAFGRLTELKLSGDARKHRRARRDELQLSQAHAVLAQGRLRRRAARTTTGGTTSRTLGKLLAERIAADGHDACRAARPQHGRPGGARRAHACRRQAGFPAGHARHAELRIGGARCRHCAAPIPWCASSPCSTCGTTRNSWRSEVFSSFPGLHELLPVRRARQRPRPVRPGGMARAGSRPGRGAVAGRRRARRNAWRPRIRASTWWSAAIASPPPRVALRDGDFEYEYSLRGDGTVPIELARLDGARHRYVDCDHSDMPLSDRVIAGTIDLLKTGKTRRFAAAPPHPAQCPPARARRGAAARIPGQGRLAAHESRGTPAVPGQSQRTAAQHGPGAEDHSTSRRLVRSKPRRKITRRKR